MIRPLLALVAALALTPACSKKEAASDKAGPAAAAKSGLEWEPVGYDQLSAACKKDLACCEAVLKAEKGSPTADDYNLSCSGPALWKEADCTTDLEMRRKSDKPVPDACK